MKNYLSIFLFIFIIQFTFGQEEKSTQFYFIRHAEKVKNSGDDPVLTQLGEQRALHWADVFKNIDFDAIYSTETIRTIATALPSAVQSAIEVTPYDTKTVDLFKLAEKHPGKSILIVGHSNTIPSLVNTLIGKDRFEEIEKYNNSNLYIVNYREGISNVILLYIDFNH